MVWICVIAALSQEIMLLVKPECSEAELYKKKEQRFIGANIFARIIRCLFHHAG